jgi:hypothetical protein
MPTLPIKMRAKGRKETERGDNLSGSTGNIVGRQQNPE